VKTKYEISLQKTYDQDTPDGWCAMVLRTVFGRVQEFGDTKEEALKNLTQKLEELMAGGKDLFCEVHNRWLEENE
jgi:predicted RNase H-like HicB family nuclease